MSKSGLIAALVGLLIVSGAIVAVLVTFFGAPPSVEIPEFEGKEPIETKSGLKYVDLVVGTGAEIKTGSDADIFYVGRLLSGLEFENNRSGSPYRVNVGSKQVIAGWDEGLIGMKQGGKRVLVIPPELGYGEQGKGKIPGGTTLVFIVEAAKVADPSGGLGQQPVAPKYVPALTWADVAKLKKAVDKETVAWVKAQDANSPGQLTTRLCQFGLLNLFAVLDKVLYDDEQKERPIVKTASGLQYVDFKLGTGREAAKNSVVVLHYTGRLQNGTIFDSSIAKNAPYELRLGMKAVIDGWEEGIPGMKVGGKRKLIIPPSLGYGGQRKDIIPPNSTLIFEIELFEVK